MTAIDQMIAEAERTDFGHVEVYLANEDQTVRLGGIIQHGPRGQGQASKALHKLCELADKWQVTMSLWVDPIKSYDPTMSKIQLLKWYERLGFVSDRPRYIFYMERKPKMKIQAVHRLVWAAANEVPFHKYVPDTEAHSKLPLPPGKWKQVERNYMKTNQYEVAAKGDKLAAAIEFYESKGYKQSGNAWGPLSVKMKAPTPDLRLILSYDQHNKQTVIEFTMVKNKTSASAVHAGRETGEGAGALFYCPETENFLLMLRSDDNTWCGLGGGRDDMEPLEVTVRRESFEEAGLDMDHPMELRRVATVHHPDGFKFTNYLGLVDEEFLPVINFEHKGFMWCKWNEFPKNMHPKMMEAFHTPDGQRILKHYTTALDY